MKLSKALEIIQETECRMSKVEEWVGSFMEEIIEHAEQISSLNWNMKEALEILLGNEVGKDANYENNDDLLKESPWLKTLVEYYKSMELSKEELQKKLDSCNQLENFFSDFDI